VELDAGTVAAARDAQFAALQDEEAMAADADGTLEMGGERFNIMGADYFMAGIFHALTAVHGEGAGGILRQSGRGYGEDLFGMVDGTDQAAFGRFLGLLQFLGYSRPAVEAETVTVPASPTAVEYRRADHAPRPTCYFLAGMLTGAAQEVDADAQFVEERCRADGDDACVFRLA